MRLRAVSPREVEIVLEGRIATDDMNDFQRLLADALRGVGELIAFDLSGCENLDSWAIGKMLHFRGRCELAGRRLVIRRCNPRIRQQMQMIRFDELIRFED
jgi:anti-anti-sigma regulatory factor